MVEKKFFEGERIGAELVHFEENSPERVTEVILGRIIGPLGLNSNPVIYQIRGDDGKEYEFGEFGEGLNYLHVWTRVPDKSRADGYREAKDLIGRCNLKRLNLEELREDFPNILEKEIGLIRRLAQESDETRKSAVLVTARNLTRYLSEKIDEAYKEAEILARASDETGRAAALATLRNLNDYLRKRQKSERLSD